MADLSRADYRRILEEELAANSEDNGETGGLPAAEEGNVPVEGRP
ncbi:MAG: hypothetical protein SVW02_03440 [Candidatus Nanohaloarchaea archaeon]|nr:hypothetical protein [Candidatus Nanohaloarchaea archaeon]